MSRFSAINLVRGVLICLAVAVLNRSATAQDSGSSGGGGGDPIPARRPPGNLLNGGKSSFQQAPPSLVPPDVGSGLNKAGGVLTVTNVGMDIYEGKKSGGKIALDAAGGVAQGIAITTGAGAAGALLGAPFGPSGAAAGWEIGSTGAAILLTTKGAVDTGERLSQAIAEHNVKTAMNGVSGPNTWVELPAIPGSPAAKEQGWINLPPVPGSAADIQQSGHSTNSVLGPPPPRDPNAKWPICAKCGQRHDPNE